MTQGPRSARRPSPLSALSAWSCQPGECEPPSAVSNGFKSLSRAWKTWLSPSPSDSQAEPPWWPRGASCPPAPALPCTCHRCSEPGLGLLQSSPPRPAGSVSGVPPDTCTLQSPPAPSTGSSVTAPHPGPLKLTSRLKASLAPPSPNERNSQNVCLCRCVSLCVCVHVQ